MKLGNKSIGKSYQSLHFVIGGKNARELVNLLVSHWVPLTELKVLIACSKSLTNYNRDST